MSPISSAPSACEPIFPAAGGSLQFYTFRCFSLRPARITSTQHWPSTMFRILFPSLINAPRMSVGPKAPRAEIACSRNSGYNFASSGMEPFCWLRSSLLVGRGRSTGGDSTSKSPNPRLRRPVRRRILARAAAARPAMLRSQGGRSDTTPRTARPISRHRPGPGPPEIRPPVVRQPIPFPA